MHIRTITVAGKTIEVGEEGFLVNRLDWSEKVAQAMAKADEFELTPEHREIINFMREFFEEHQIPLFGRVWIKEIGKKLGPDKGNSKYLYALFPCGANQANRYAGLCKVCSLY